MLADVSGLDAVHTLQLDGRQAAMHGDMSVAILGGDVAVRVQIGERMPLDADRGVTLDEIVNEVLAADLVRKGGEEVALHAALAGRVVCGDVVD